MWITFAPWFALVWRPIEWESFKFHTGPVAVYSAKNLWLLKLLSSYAAAEALSDISSINSQNPWRTSGLRDKSDYGMILYHLTSIRERRFGLNFLVITGNLWHSHCAMVSTHFFQAACFFFPYIFPIDNLKSLFKRVCFRVHGIGRVKYSFAAVYLHNYWWEFFCRSNVVLSPLIRLLDIFLKIRWWLQQKHIPSINNLMAHSRLSKH